MHIENRDIYYQTPIRKIRETYNSKDKVRKSPLPYTLETSELIFSFIFAILMCHLCYLVSVNISLITCLVFSFCLLAFLF